MPSEAYKNFKKNLGEVQRFKGVQITKASKSDPRKGFPQNNRLVSRQLSHIPVNRQLSHMPVSRQLSHINRYALIILCGYWDQYIIDVVRNLSDALLASRNASIESIKKSIEDARHLPKSAQKTVGINIVKLQNDLEILESMRVDWKSFHEARIEQAVKNFRSPTRKNIGAFFKDSIGVEGKMFQESKPSDDIGQLDGIIKKRNNFAHSGVQDDEYFQRQALNKNIGIIRRLAAKTDNYLLTQLTKMHPKGEPPWKGRAR